MNFEEITDLYDQAVVSWLVRNGHTRVSEHIINIIRNVLMARDRQLLTPGTFALAVINNDLGTAISHADDECLANLKLIYQGYYNITTHNLVPKTMKREVSW